MANLAAYDFDAQRSPRPSSIRRRPATTAITASTGRSTAGAYTVTSVQGPAMRIDGMTIDDVGVRPSRLQLPALLAALPPRRGGANAGASARADRKGCPAVRGLSASAMPEMRGLSMDTPEGRVQTRRDPLQHGERQDRASSAFEGS